MSISRLERSDGSALIGDLGLFETRQLEYRTRWFLRQRDRIATDREFVLIPRTADRELALGHYRFGCERIASDRVGACVQIERIEHIRLVRLGGFVVRRVIGQRLVALNAREAVMLLRENVQTRLRAFDLPCA